MRILVSALVGGLLGGCNAFVVLIASEDDTHPRVQRSAIYLREHPFFLVLLSTAMVIVVLSILSIL